MKKSLVFVMSCLCGFYSTIRAASVDDYWNPTAVGATITNASSWSESANWINSTIPQISDSFAGFTNTISGTEYILLPNELTIGSIYNKTGYRSYIGDLLNLDSQAGFTTPQRAGRIQTNNDKTRIYADIYVPKDFSGSFSACGSVTQTNLPTSTKRLTLSIGAIHHRADLYAHSSDPNRDSEFIVNYINYSSGYLSLYGPRGSEGTTGAWSQTAGSPYLFYVSGTEGYSLPVGTIVTGTGIPAGTFLKRIFSDNSIELSNPVSSTVASNALAFAAITPNVRQVCGELQQGAYNESLTLSKYREEDIYRFEVFKLDSANHPSTIYMNLTAAWGCYPGTLVLHDTSTFDHKLRFQNAHVEFAETGNASVPAGLPDAAIAYFHSDSSVARVTVTNGISAQIPVFTNFIGTLTKDGTGSLSIGLAGTENNAAAVQEGTLSVSHCITNATTTLQSLTISDGAVFKLEEDQALTLADGTVAQGGILEVSAGAELTILSPVSLVSGTILRGPGTIIVQSASAVAGTVQQNGVTVRSPAILDQPVESGVPVGQIVGHPAFWIDADAGDSITTNSSAFITRINDCRAGETMFATNVVNAPTYLPGMVNSKPCIVMGYGGRRTNGFVDGEGLVWSLPIEGIRAVFTVIVPNGYAVQDGGGSILGCTPRLDTSWFFCEYWGTWNQPIFDDDTPALVRTAPLYINGVPWTYGDGYMQQGIPQVIESHPFAPGAASDAFGYDLNGGAYSGCQTLCEAIVYTNELTQSERLQIGQYLAQKWCARDIAVNSRFVEQQKLGSYTLTGSSSFEVPDGSSLGITMLTGSGELVKKGTGTLYLDGLAATDGTVHVSEGAAVIRSAAVPTFADLPSGTYLHVDATQADTMTVQDYSNGSLITTNMVREWHDRRGGNVYATPRIDIDPRYRGGVLVTNALNGLNVVDYGPLKVGSTTPIEEKHFHQFQTAPSTRSHAENVQNAFVVIGSEEGGNSVLGGFDTGYGIPRTISTDYTQPIVSSSAESPFKFLRSWVNGSSIEPRTTGLSGGYDVVSFAADCPGFQVDAFSAHTYLKCGGQQLGEALIYTNQLSWDEHAKVDAYLNTKWFNRSTSYFSPAVVGELTVDAGATLAVNGDVPLTVSSLSGAGTITGAVALAEQAVLEVTVNENGTITPLTIDGLLTFENGATAQLTGAVDKLEKGAYTLVSCTSLTAGQPGQWTVEGGSDHIIYTVSVQNGALVLRVSSPGTIIIIH